MSEETPRRCAMCGRFIAKGQGCPVHDPHWAEEVVYGPEVEKPCDAGMQIWRIGVKQ